MIFHFASILIGLGTPNLPANDCATVLAQPASTSARILVDPSHREDQELALVRRYLEAHTAALKDAGFTLRPFDVLIDYDNSAQRQLSIFKGHPWQPLHLHGPAVLNGQLNRFSVPMGGTRKLLPTKDNLLYLPFQLEDERRFASQDYVIAHELGHLTEPAHFQEPLNYKELTPFHKVQLVAWKEGRACLIDYLLTGNDTVIRDADGEVEYSIGHPTYANIHEIGPRAEEHILGQLIGHVILETARKHDRAWLVKLLHLMDEKISPAGHKVRNRYAVHHAMNTLAMDIPEDFLKGIPTERRPEKIKRFQQVIHMSYEGMDYAFGKFLEAALDLGASPTEIAQARRTMKSLGFHSLRQ